MASGVPDVAMRIGETVLTSYVLDEDSPEEGKRKEYTRNGCVVLATLSASDLDPDVRTRVDYCVNNVSTALKMKQKKQVVKKPQASDPQEPLPVKESSQGPTNAGEDELD